MPPIRATNYQSAIDLVSQYALDPRHLQTGQAQNSNFLEVDADGSIRAQNWKEKLVNFGSRLIGKFEARKDTKDAAVAIALQSLYESALTQSGPDQSEQIYDPKTYA